VTRSRRAGGRRSGRAQAERIGIVDVHQDHPPRTPQACRFKSLS
jgi:hypothetical protein